jgi:hypothetical protein
VHRTNIDPDKPGQSVDYFDSWVVEQLRQVVRPAAAAAVDMRRDMSWPAYWGAFEGATSEGATYSFVPRDRSLSVGAGWGIGDCEEGVNRLSA